MPGDEAGEGFDFAGAVRGLEATDATGELCEAAWNGENQIRVGSGVNGGHEEEIDPTQDGAEVVNGVLDRVRAEMLRRVGLEDFLSPRNFAASKSKSAAS